MTGPREAVLESLQKDWGIHGGTKAREIDVEEPRPRDDLPYVGIPGDGWFLDDASSHAGVDPS
jgi:hypothetical protein